MKTTANNLGAEEISSLLYYYAIPAVFSGLVAVAYNIVDQIFIGHSVGMLGSAATNVVFPIITVCMAISMMSGVGCSAAFNMATGRGNLKEAGRYVGNTLVLMIVAGSIIGIICLLFLKPIIMIFGATASTFLYAQTYLGIIAWGIPFSIFGIGGSIMIRSDGSPTYSLVSISVGALANVLLDAVFIFIFGMGIAGAAWATVIGQVMTALLVGFYFRRFKTVALTREDLRMDFAYIRTVAALGMGPLINNLSMFVVQIMLNNALNHYGAASQYGSDIPLACVGVITKLMSLFNAVVIGIAQGVQPIISYNFGAKQFGRVREAAKMAISVMLSVSFVFFLCCQFFPRQLVSIFGIGSDAYYDFAAKYLRIFMMFICVSGLQITAGNIFTSVGKAKLSVGISLTRQVIFFPVLILVLPQIYGIDGVLYAGPIADGMCVLIAVMLLYWGNGRLKTLELQQELAMV